MSAKAYDNISSVSVIIPAYNEGKNVTKLLTKTIGVLKSLKIEFEIIVIDDGSEDNTSSLIEKLTHKNGNITILKHSNKEGKSLCLKHGFDQAKGDAIVMIDADLQYDPNEIPLLLDILENGYDVANGYRDFNNYPLSKTIISRIYNEVTKIMLGNMEIHDLNCGFKAFRKEVAKNLLMKFKWRRGIHRYIISLCHTLGFKIKEVKVSLCSRIYGKSKYSLHRILEGFLVLLLLFMEIRLVNYQKLKGS